MTDILHIPYCSQYKWFAPMELIRRAVFIVAITAVPGNTVRFKCKKHEEINLFIKEKIFVKPFFFLIT